MENNKLGIVINTTKANNRTSGFRTIYSFNRDDWASVVRDTGAELKMVTNNTSCDPIHFVQFVSNGCCYCVMQSIAGRKDYQSAWIFIHKDINLPKGTLASVIKKVEEVLSLDVEDKKDELDSLFNKSYPTNESPCYLVSSGDVYAVRYYGENTNFMYNHNDVLEDFLYQSEYCKYKSVFLIDKSKGQSVSEATDLSDTKLQKSIVIEVPSEIDGFKHDLGTNSIRVTEGTSIKIRWSRTGYADIEKTGKTSEELVIKKSEYKRSFRISLFRIIDKNTKKEINANVRFISANWIDNRTNPQIVFFKEEDLNRISLHIDKPAYHSYSDVIDLTKPNENGEYIIELQPEEHIYNCYIATTIQDCKKVEFTIRTQYKLRGDEIPGFKFDGTPSETIPNKLKAAPQPLSSTPCTGGKSDKSGSTASLVGNVCNDGKSKKKHKKGAPWYRYVLIVLLFLTVIAGGYMLYDYLFLDKPEIELVNSEQPKNDWEEAIEYLKENNTYWDKSQMEKYPELKGVYVMIKDFQFKELKSFIEEHKHKNELLELDSWSRLYDIASKYNNKKGTFYTSNDRIDIEKYLTTDFESKKDVIEPETFSNESNEDISSTNNNGSRTNSNSKTSSHTGNTTNNSHSSNTSNSNTQDLLQ